MIGRILGEGTAEAPDAPDLPFWVIVPACTPENIAVVELEHARWSATVDKIQAIYKADPATYSPWLWIEADFVKDAIEVVAESIRDCAEGQVTWQTNDLIAVSPYNQILSVMTYIPGPYTAKILFFASDPRFLPLSPLPGKYRGVGVAMLAAASRRFLAEGYREICLAPADEAATKFYERRGFRWGVGEGMCVSGRAEIEALIDGCSLGAGPEGEIVFCRPRRKSRQN